MRKKVIITGGLGYIGTEICKIYSGVSWNNDIVVLDNRFISERVNQLRNWNINFIHGDILDKNLISKGLLSKLDFINNLDINLICEQPKISKHRNKIIKGEKNLADLQPEPHCFGVFH